MKNPCFAIIACLPLYVYGSGVRTLYSSEWEAVVFADREDQYFTLDSKPIPQIYDSGTFLLSKNMYDADRMENIANRLLLEFLRTGAALNIEYFLQFDLSSSQANKKNISEDIAKSIEQNSLDTVQVATEFLKENKVSNDFKFLMLVNLLHNQDVPDKSILEFINFINLPKDYVFSAESLSASLGQADILEDFLRNQFGKRDINDRVTDMFDRLGYEGVNSGRELIGSVADLMETRVFLPNENQEGLTNFQNEIASSPRAYLIKNTLKKKHLIFIPQI